MKGRTRLHSLAAWLCLAALCLAACAVRPAGPAADPPLPLPPASTAPTEPPTPEEDAGELALRARLKEMSLRELAGQVFFIRPDALDPAIPQGDINNSTGPGVTEVSEEMRAVLANYPVGGMVFFQKNTRSPEQLTAFMAQLQEASTTPLIFCVDEEGGAVTRLAGAPGFALPRFESAAAVGRRGEAAAEEMGRIIGGYLRAYGFHMDLAPVADVNTNPLNPVIGERAFSRSPAQAAVLAGAMARGLSAQGVIPTLKHFPGHGDTAEDSHVSVAVTEKTLRELERCEWLPYSRNDLRGWAVMVGHIAAPKVTGEATPAAFSEKLVTDCLRGRLGFDGLVITDSMAMDAVTRSYDPGTAAVLALRAGCDVILMPNGLGEAFEGLMDALERGEISRTRLEESVYRILLYKQQAGIM